MCPAPDFPASRLAQLGSTSAPSGGTKPSPVTTIRRIVFPFVGPCPRKDPHQIGGRISTKKASRSLRARARDRDAGNAWPATPPRTARPAGPAIALLRFKLVDLVLSSSDLFRPLVGHLDAEVFD